MGICKSKLTLGIFIFLIITPFLTYASENQPDGRPVGYSYSPDSKVLHIWNFEDDYYFNATSGMQFTNHYNEYWSKNVFCGGYWDGDNWIKFACVDELPFTWSINTDNQTYINVTGYRDVKFLGRKVRFALRYHLKTYDTRLSVIPYMKNIGTLNIPLIMGFAWRIKDINIDMEEENNTLRVYNSFYEESLVGLEKTYVDTDGYLFINNNDSKEHIFLGWDKNIPHIVDVRLEEGQYNSPVSLGLKIGTLAVEQEKSTVIEWVDANPYCENVGTDGNEAICFYDAFTVDSYTNYSDATLSNSRYPNFKITYSSTSPVGCTRTCTMYRQNTIGGGWTQVDYGVDGGCYNVYPVSTGNCYLGTNGYCKMLHTREIDNRTQWDLCIRYSGRLCSENGNIYCGMGSQTSGSWSNNGDYRLNMSYNAHTPINEDVTILKDNITQYDDTEDSSTSTGSWFVTFPFSNVVDENWGTFSFCNSEGCFGYINYTKPCGAFDAIWQVKDQGGTINITIPSECFNQEVLQFSVESDASNSNTKWDCWNGTNWKQLRFYDFGAIVYEEAINWNISILKADFDINQFGDPDSTKANLTRWYFDGIQNISLNNLTQIGNCYDCDTNITLDVQSWDDSYFSPTGEEDWTASNNSFFEACEIIITEVRESYWFLAVITCMIGTIVILFMISKQHQIMKAKEGATTIDKILVNVNNMMRIPFYVTEVLLLIMLIYFSGFALGAFEGTTVIETMMVGVFSVIIKFLLPLIYLTLIISFIHRAFKKLKKPGLNKP